MKINVYKNRKIEKTYTADTYDLMFGTLEDISDAVKIDDLKTGSDTEILGAVINLLKNSMGTVKDLMKDIFEGITDEELRRVHVLEMAQAIVEVVQYTIGELGKGFGSKN